MELILTELPRALAVGLGFLFILGLVALMVISDNWQGMKQRYRQIIAWLIVIAVIAWVFFGIATFFD